MNNDIIPGPRIYPSGGFLSQTGGHADTGSFNDVPGDVDDLEAHMFGFIADGVPEVIKAARHNLRASATQIKVMAGGGVASEFDPLHTTQYSLEELKAIVGVAEDYGTYVLVHAYHDRSVNRAIDAGVRVIDHNFLVSEETIIRMKEEGVALSIQAVMSLEAFGDPDSITFFSADQKAKAKQVNAGARQMMEWAVKHELLMVTGGVAAQSLAGPSSVQADLEPGDGLSDPQFRSDFPNKIAPNWFAWKDDLAKKGFKFNINYLSLGQSSSSNIGAGEAASGIARFYGAWQATERGSLTFKIENRHAYGAVAPQFLGLDGGALSITGTVFDDSGTMLTNLFWTQRTADESWTFQFGQIDVSDFLDIYGLVSPYTGFQNLAFNTNPTINAPNPGLGMAGGTKLGSNFYLVGSVADANADPTSPDLDVFSHGNLFKSLEFGYTSGMDRVYFDNIHLTLWHADAADNGTRAEDYGASFSAAWFIDNQWMPFVRAGMPKGTAALYDKSLSAGVGYYGRNTDLVGLGVNWAEANGVSGSQTTLEAFYRFSISPNLQITPSLQHIHNPLLHAGQSSITVLGHRARVVF